MTLRNKSIISPGVVLAIAMSMVSCTKTVEVGPVGEVGNAPGHGFVREVDEPGGRGQVQRVSMPDMDVEGRIAISPNGKSIVFSGKKVGADDLYQLYRLDIGSTVAVKITAGGEYNAWDPSFTSDGGHIVYRMGNSFWKIRNDGSGSRVKLPGSGLTASDWCPQVSSENRLVFMTWQALDPFPLIWTVGLDGSELTQFREGRMPTWSPDGSKIAFEYKGDLWLMNADGRELTQLTSTPDCFEGLPFFSPDGTKIAFASDEESISNIKRNVNIWYINIDGTGKTQVTALKSWDSWPAWGKDGIYFLSGRGKGGENVSRVWRMGVD